MSMRFLRPAPPLFRFPTSHTRPDLQSLCTFTFTHPRYSTTHTHTHDWNRHDDFFSFTRARFVTNEDSELARQRVQFDMNELVRIGPASIGSASKVVNVEKYPDGWYSKAFLMTLEDGHDFVVKVANLHSSRPHCLTASEVASMDFVRTARDPRRGSAG